VSKPTVSSMAAGDTQDHLLALPEVAKRLACSPGTVRRLDARGVLPRVRLGRAVRYRASDVARLVTEGVPCGPARAA
jgi:excisionase family DNA binding protein